MIVQGLWQEGKRGSRIAYRLSLIAYRKSLIAHRRWGGGLFVIPYVTLSEAKGLVMTRISLSP